MNTLLFRSLRWLLAAAAFSSVTAAEATLTLAPVDTVNRPGVLAVDVIAINRSDVAVPSGLPDDGLIPVSIHERDRSWHATMTAIEPGRPMVAPGGFVAVRYTVALPTDATGRLVIEARPQGHAPIAAVIKPAPVRPDADIELARPLVDDVPPARIAASDPRYQPAPQPATDLINRGFLKNFTAHEPIYFIYGPDAPAAKFQFSFKYRMAALSADSPAELPTTLQFGFTQRSLWDIDATSSPFYDTSYMPEIMIEKIAALPEEPDHWFNWLGMQGGFRHESNGRDGDVSRSLNVIFARAALALGDPASLHLVIAPEVFTYVGGLSNNRDLTDFRGYGQLRLHLSYGDGPSLTAKFHTGDDLDHFTTELDLHIPVSVPLIDAESFFLLQYYEGYGESLLNYGSRDESLRAGLSLVR
ncbi:phospholipase A [Synoicihabitans lomoniglobus]|uniref:Phosphatidylcholine 1-acylhydrolase n=1 Tax=Synoicihabitans lomoniglobus TaxID=2909285 RepID=A0AAE9ZY54_9BACT|nr:phospholipase A [Opitutaceae bacterium LMO-M01]WED63313.1 phospholipase A [Opitutaceae bacterium LMO-M01]